MVTNAILIDAADTEIAEAERYANELEQAGKTERAAYWRGVATRIRASRDRWATQERDASATGGISLPAAVRAT